MGDMKTASGSQYFIGPAAGSNIDLLAEFEALSYTEIGMVEDGGEFGDEASAVTGAVLGDGRTRKAKGARDAGTIALICFHDHTDPGQAAVEAAEQTSDNYAFKVILNDKQSPNWSNSIYYFRALVMSRRKRVGTNDNIMRNVYNLGINSALVLKAPVFTT